MNYINLLELIKNHINYDVFKALNDDFLKDYQAEYKNLRPCKSAAEKAIKNYVSRATFKDEKTAVYGDGHTCLIVSNYIPEAENAKIKSVDLATPVKDMFSDRVPTECYFMDCLALYKTLKKQAKQDYFLEIDGHFFNAGLVAEMLDCIATKKETYIRAELCKLGSTARRALMISQGAGAVAIILPVVGRSADITKNINAQTVFKHIDGIREALFDAALQAARKGA